MRRAIVLVFGLALSACQKPVSSERYDVILRGGTVYDGTGAPGVTADVAIRGDRIVRVGDLSQATATVTVEAGGRAVAPGFINVLSHSEESLIADGRSESEIRQGVTLEIMGEGGSMGPLNDAMKKESTEQQADIKYEIAWTTLAEYLDWLAARGLSTNIASLVGATSVRVHELGYANVKPTREQLARMQALVARAMEDGALGIGTALIYTPASFASTEELVALCEVVARYGGVHATHMRSEADRFLEAIDETVQIARATGVRTEIFHLKAAGEDNWPKMPRAIDRIEAARRDGIELTANMYPYPAAATGLDAAMPPWVQEGGLDAWVDRLRQPEIRKRVADEMRVRSRDWENFYAGAGSPDRLLLIGFKNPALKPLTGKSLAEVAAQRGTTPEDTAMDLVVEDHTRVGTAYFLMSEANVELGLRQPWVSIGSDEASQAPAGPFLESNPHPRAYGSFARFLGHYVRDRQVAPLADAIRRMTGLPAKVYGVADRGCLRAGCFADVVVFDPQAVSDASTFAVPHVFSTGVTHVFVNGEQVLRDGEHTGATPGRVVRGPGYRP